MAKKKASPKPPKKEAKNKELKVLTMSFTLAGWGPVKAGQEFTGELENFCSKNSIDMSKYIK